MSAKKSRSLPPSGALASLKVAKEQFQTILVQYAFLDVVGFTLDRTVEAQVHVLDRLNRIVRTALRSPEEQILLPTGDGLCVAFLNPASYDRAVRFGLDVLNRVHRHNARTPKTDRRFQLRIGVNQNVDNLVTDINGNQNLAGRGINRAQRIMNLADSSQMLVGDQVHELLCERERYKGNLRLHRGIEKHGQPLTVYQLIFPNRPSLNIDIPSKFRVETTSISLPDSVAHYLANAFKYREFLLRHRTDDWFENSAVVLLKLLAEDSERLMNANRLEQLVNFVEFKDGEPGPTYQMIHESHLWMRRGYAESVRASLQQFAHYFERSSYEPLYQFVTDEGVARLKREQPLIWAFVVGQGQDGAPSADPQ